MPLEWISEPAAFTSETWDRLCAADPESTIFHTPRYLKLYWEELGAGPPHLALVGGREPVAACAFEISDGLLSFLGGFEVTDYMGPVGDPEARDHAARALIEGLVARDDWQRADLEGLPEDGTWLGALRSASQAAGLDARIADDDVAPMLELPASYDVYLGMLRSKQRHEIRRKARRLAEAAGAVRVTASTPATLDEDLDRFAAMHRSSEGEKGRFMQPGIELFFRRISRALLPDGTMRLLFLEVDGVKVAGAIGFRSGGTMSLYNSAFDRAQADLAPGMVLATEVIRDAIDAGCARLDLLKGDLSYKYRLGARPRPVKRLLLERAR